MGCRGRGSAPRGTWMLMFLVFAVGCAPAHTAAPPNTAAAVVEARSVLPEIEVRDKAPFAGYSRERFGDGWADLDGDGCRTREEILQRDLEVTQTDGCRVFAGVLADPYSGDTVQFRRGPQSSEEVQIDHVVALANAWQTGAREWTPRQRLEFANDPLVLLAVTGDLNQEKGSGDAAAWLPPNQEFRCAYVSLQVLIKHKYGLWVTPEEHDAMRSVLNRC